MHSALTYVEAYSPSPHLLIAGDIGALAGAPIQELVLLGCEQLTGTSTSCFYKNASVAPRQHIKEAFQECSSFLLTPSLQHTTIGDVSVFKDMPIKELELGGCAGLTGEWVRIS